MELDEDTLKDTESIPTTSTRTLRSGSSNDEVIQREDIGGTLEQLKREATTYFQIGRLVQAIESVWQWREVEQQHTT